MSEEDPYKEIVEEANKKLLRLMLDDDITQTGAPQLIRKAIELGVQQSTQFLANQLQLCRDKAYKDYREFVGLTSQNESLRRELDRINQHVKEMLERQAEKEKYDHFPFTPKNWPT